MNRDEKYLLGRFKKGGPVCAGFYLAQLQRLSKRGYCEITERDLPDADTGNTLWQINLTAKGMEAIGG